MPDTGAPYFIPYVEPTDLVRDYPAADEASAEAIAAALDAIPVLAGIGSNVVQTVKTDTFTTTDKTFGDIPGLTVTITPTSVSSKVLLLARLSTGATATANWGFAFRFNGGNADDFVGDADGNKTRSAHGFTQDNFPAFNQFTVALAFVDSPATTSATTYAVQVKGGGSATGTIFINRSSSQDNTELTSVNASSLIAIEVAA